MKWHLPSNTRINVRSTVSTVSVHVSGKIRFNHTAIDLFELKDRDSVAFGQGDGEDNKDWFVKKDKEGFAVSVKKDSKTTSGYINSKQLAYNIFLSIEKTEAELITFKIIPEQKDGCYAILTSNPIRIKIG